MGHTKEERVKGILGERLVVIEMSFIQNYLYQKAVFSSTDQIQGYTRVSNPHFFADPDPGKNLHAEKKIKLFFTFQLILNNLKKLKKIFGSKLSEKDD